MVVYNTDVVNIAFDVTCPELKGNRIGRYPMKYDRWLQPGEVTDDGKKTFIASPTADQDVKEDYVWCKFGSSGPGYYHLRTRIAYVNLGSRFQRGPPGGFCCFGGPDKEFRDHWDTATRVIHNRSNMARPDDIGLSEAGTMHFGHVGGN